MKWLLLDAVWHASVFLHLDRLSRRIAGWQIRTALTLDWHRPTE